MFYIAESFLLGRGLSFSRHAAVISAFGKEFAKTGDVPAKYHRFLIEGHSARTLGNYEAEPHVTRENADEHLRRAAGFIALAEERL